MTGVWVAAAVLFGVVLLALMIAMRHRAWTFVSSGTYVPDAEVSHGLHLRGLRTSR